MKSFFGEYFNGKNAGSERVECLFHQEQLEIKLISGEKLLWRRKDFLAEIRGTHYGVVKKQKEEVLFLKKDFLLIEKILFPKKIKLNIPTLLISLVSIITVFYLLVPYLAYSIANIIPPSLEKKFSNPLFNEFKQTDCEDPRANRVLRSFLEHLDSKAKKYEILYSSRMEVNAFALPGNRIVVLKGLIDFVDSADELFAILAHERAHIENKHHIRLLLKRHFFTLVFSSLSGNLGGIIDALGGIAMAYTVPEEIEADKSAIELLKAKNIPLSGGIYFFSKMAVEQADSSDFFNISHPGTEERVKLWTNASLTKKNKINKKWEKLFRQLKSSCSYF